MKFRNFIRFLIFFLVKYKKGPAEMLRLEFLSCFAKVKINTPGGAFLIKPAKLAQSFFQNPVF